MFRCLTLITIGLFVFTTANADGNLWDVVKQGKPVPRADGSEPFSFTTPATTGKCVEVNMVFYTNANTTTSCTGSCGNPQRYKGCNTASHAGNTYYFSTTAVYSVLQGAIDDGSSCTNETAVCARERDQQNFGNSVDRGLDCSSGVVCTDQAGSTGDITLDVNATSCVTSADC